MPLPHGMLLCLGILLMTAGVVVALCVGMPNQSMPLFVVGLFLGLGGVGLLVSGLCMAMKNLQAGVPGHFLIQPRTGMCFSPQQALAIQRTMERHRQLARGEELDYPPMEPGGFSPSPHPPPWLEPPPPYEVAIKTTCSSTHLRRAYSDTHLATEPLFGRSREISFEV